MMSLYKLADGSGQLVLLGPFKAVLNVLDNNLGALLKGQFIVRIRAALVLGEEDGILNLSDIMIEGTGSHQLAFGAKTISNLGSQIGHLHAVLEGARGILREAPQHLIVDIGELNQRNGGGETEYAFDGDEQQIGNQREYARNA